MSTKENVFLLLKNGTKRSQIPKILGISRQRVSQIINGYKSITNAHLKNIGAKYYGPCQKCEKKPWRFIRRLDGDIKNNSKENISFLCEECSKILTEINSKPKKCRNCGKIVQKDQKGGFCIECKEKRKKRFSIKYDKCIMCETSTKKHVSRGLCQKCYSKIRYDNNLNNYRDRLKEAQKRWVKKNKDKAKEISNKAVKLYYERNKELLKEKRRERMRKKMEDQNYKKFHSERTAFYKLKKNDPKKYKKIKLKVKIRKMLGIKGRGGYLTYK